MVEDVLTYLYKRSGKQNNNPLGTMRVSTNLLGYIHSVVSVLTAVVCWQ